MVSQRIALNLYLLEESATPAMAISIPADTTGAALLQEADDEAPGDEASESWTRSWLLDEVVSEEPLPDSRDGPPSLLVRATPSIKSWQSLVEDVVPGIDLGGAQSNLGGLLFQRVGSHVVVWSFGNAWTLLDPARTVDRFGLRVGLNALLSSPAPSASGTRKKDVGIRGLTSAVRAAVVRRSTVLTARPSSPNSMERVDQASDAAAAAELTTHHPTFDRVSAGRSLRFQASVASLDELAVHAAEAIRLHDRDDYTKDDAYKWIDYTVPVGDRAEVDNLLDELLTQATANPPVAVDFVWADADPATGVTPWFVCFPGERSTTSAAKRTEMTWQYALAWINSQRGGLPGHEALRMKLRFFEDSGALTQEVELWQQLVAQLSVGTRTFMISDGEIWRVSSAHIADIDNLLAPHVVVNPPSLPPYQGGEREDTYNKRASKFGDHFLLDKKLIQVPGQSSFEPCDLLSGDGHFMHIKRKTSSSTMSHLVAQALVSTQLLRSDADARNRLDQVLQKAKPAPQALQAMRDHCASFAARPTGIVQVVIVGSWRGTPDITQLPLFTRIALNGWLRQMPCQADIALVGT